MRFDPLTEAQRIVAHDGDHAFEAVVPPIAQTSLFTFETVADMAATFAGERSRFVYSRTTNPTVRLFEEKMAALEGAEDAIGLASGMGAISSSVLAFVRAGGPHRLRAPCLPGRLPAVRDPPEALEGQDGLCRRRRPRCRGGGPAWGQALLHGEPDELDHGRPRRRSPGCAGEGAWRHLDDRQFLGDPGLPAADPPRGRPRRAFGVEIYRRPFAT